MKLTKGSMKNKQKAFPKEHGKTNLISKLHSSSSPSLTHLLLSSHSLTLSRQKQPRMTTTIWRKHIFTQWKSLMCTFQCSLLLYMCMYEAAPSFPTSHNNKNFMIFCVIAFHNELYVVAILLFFFSHSLFVLFYFFFYHHTATATARFVDVIKIVFIAQFSHSTLK